MYPVRRQQRSWSGACVGDDDFGAVGERDGFEACGCIAKMRIWICDFCPTYWYRKAVHVGTSIVVRSTCEQCVFDCSSHVLLPGKVNCESYFVLLSIILLPMESPGPTHAPL